MTAHGPGDGARTSSERALLADLDELWRADAETVADLRRFGKAISGVRRSNYRGERAEVVKQRLDRDRLKLLEHGDPALWVNEPAVLGGFGLHSDRVFFNEDTLRFFRVACLLNDAALLCSFRVRNAARDIVGSRRWLGRLRTLFQDAVSGRHVLDHRAPNPVVALRDLFDDAVPRRTVSVLSTSESCGLHA
jgi:hypothetical protein